MSRDFTYVGDVIEGLVKVMKRLKQKDSLRDKTPPYKHYNIGNHNSVNLLQFIETIENAMGKTTEKIMLPLQQGDMKDTYADVTELVKDFDY